MAISLIKRLVKGSALTAAEHDANLSAISDADTAMDTAKAAKGANSDITSLSGLTTPLSIPQGGTGSATASAARTALGVEIGVDVQAFNTHLEALRTLDKTDGNIAVTNGTTYVAESGATARATLGLTIGTDVQAYDADTAKLDVAQEWTQQQNFDRATLSDAATINWNTDTAQVAVVTLAGNRTVAAPTNMNAGGFYSLTIIQDATGGRTLTWNAVFKFASGSAPTLTSTASAVDIIVFTSDGTNLHEVGRSMNIG